MKCLQAGWPPFTNLTGKRTWVCFDCHTSNKAYFLTQQTKGPSCQHCGKLMTCIKGYLNVPKKRNKKAWLKLYNCVTNRLRR